jgi:glycerophosphoryl diester phosphodiesterase
MIDILNLKRTNETLVVAHRGFASGCRENTIAAFDKAISIGADIIEFDVRRTQDGRFIVFHDDRLEGRAISSLKFNDLRRIGLSKGYEIPELDEALQCISNRAFLDIEMKEEGDEQEIIAIILNCIKTGQFMISSFNDASIKKVKELNRDIATGLILGTENPQNPIITRLSEIFPFFRLRKTGADILVPHWKILRIWEISGIVSLRRNIIVWTVNEEEHMRRLMKKGITGITTDYLDIALRIKENMAIRHRYCR